MYYSKLFFWWKTSDDFFWTFISSIKDMNWYFYYRNNGYLHNKIVGQQLPWDHLFISLFRCIACYSYNLHYFSIKEITCTIVVLIIINLQMRQTASLRHHSMRQGQNRNVRASRSQSQEMRKMRLVAVRNRRKGYNQICLDSDEVLIIFIILHV